MIAWSLDFHQDVTETSLSVTCSQRSPSVRFTFLNIKSSTQCFEDCCLSFFSCIICLSFFDRGQCSYKAIFHCRGVALGHPSNKAIFHCRVLALGHPSNKAIFHCRVLALGHPSNKAIFHSRGVSLGHSSNKAIFHSRGVLLDGWPKANTLQ
jgi:hypothetical protein